MDYELILTRTEGNVGVVQLNRPKVNALNTAIMAELHHALAAFDATDDINCMLVTGNHRAFSAGADISQMALADPMEMIHEPFLGYWDKIAALNKPLIAAVSGFALGGGCELAMACDMIVASETARFGQPEIDIGVIPGAGGTQRMTRAVGKAIAMEVCLGARFLTAQEALQYGLINRVYSAETFMADAIAFAQSIASRPRYGLVMGKAAVNAVYEMSLSDGVQHERVIFGSMFGSADQREGMDAFLNKRKPTWSK